MNLHKKIHPVLHGRIFFFVLALGVILPLAAWGRQARGVEVQPASGSLVETLPGKIVTVSMRVSNRSASPVRLEPSVLLPAGWRAFKKEVGFEVAAGGSEIRLISFSIPAETPAGRYEIRYTIKDPASPETAAEASLTVVITSVQQLELRMFGLPRYVIAGDRYTAQLLMTNKGNVTTSLRVLPRSSSGSVLLLDSSRVQLRPNEIRELTVTVETDPEAVQKVQDVLEVLAIRDRDSVLAARTSGSVEIVPRVSGTEDRFFEFPLQVRLRAAGERTTKGVQVDVSGSGALGEGRNDRLDLLIRTPDIQARSMLGQRDEYRLTYAAADYEVWVGDRNYNLSPLTEFNRYAFGAGGKATLSGFTLGGFYNETRFLQPRQKEQAGFLKYQVGERSDLGLNYMRKIEQGTSDIVTVRGLLQPLRNSEVDLEYGRAYSGSRSDKAYAARVLGREQWIAYEARYVWAGPTYAGYYKDLEFKTLSVNIMPWSNFRLEGYFRDEERNLNRDTSLFMAPSERYVQFGLGYTDLIALYYRVSKQDDLLPIPKYRRDEEVIQVRSGHNFSALSIIANADLGTTRDTVVGKKYPFQRYNLYTSFRPTAASSIGLSVEYSRDQNVFTDQVQKRFSGSLSAWLMLGRQTQMVLGAYGSQTPDSLKQTYYLIDLALEHTFSFGHRLAIRGRQSEFTPSFTPKEFAYLVEYSIPIGVPLSRITTSGQLRGKIVDAETGQGLPNVLLYATGYTAVTDRNGEYSFPSLRPDKYYVQMDMASIGLNRVPSQPLPKEVTVVGGEEARLDLGVVRGATVSGTVLIYGQKDTVIADSSRSITMELGGYPNVILELSNAIEAHRRLSDNRGRFTFAGIRPGRWTLEVVEGNLPANHYFENERFEIDLPPAGSETRVLKILPRKRRIQILQEGQVLLETKPVDRRRPTPPAITPVPTRRAERVPAAKPEVAPPQPVAAKVPDTAFVVVRIPGEYGFTVQISSWMREEKALRETERLQRTLAYDTFVEKVDVPNVGVRYRVYAGRFSTKRLAELAAEELRKKLAR